MKKQMDYQTRLDLLWSNPIERFGGIHYPLVSLKRIFPDMQDVGKWIPGVEFKDWHHGIGKISYKNIMKMFTYHDTYQS